MERYRIHLFIVLALFLIASTAGVLLVRHFLGADRLGAEIEKRLSEALGTPVSIERLRITPGKLIELQGHDLRAWPSPEGPGLEVEQVSGSIDPFSLLTGAVQLRRIVLQRPELRVASIPNGPRRLDIDPRDAGSPHPARPADASQPGIPSLQGGDSLSPLVAVESMVRALLSATPVASDLELRDGRVVFEGSGTRGVPSLLLEDINGWLIHQRARRLTELFLEANLKEGSRPRGKITLNGFRDRSGTLRITLAVTSFEIKASASYLLGRRPQAHLEGVLNGKFDYEASAPGTGQLRINLVCSDFSSRVRGTDPSALELFELPRIDIEGTLEWTPQSVSLHEARISSNHTTLQMNAAVRRPFQPSSRAKLSLEFENVEVSQVRQLAGWLPEIKGEEAAAIVAPLESGRLESLKAGGSATLSGWQAFLAGRTRRLPTDFAVDAVLVDTVVRVSETDQLEGIQGQLRWRGESAEILEATGTYNGTSMPILNLVIDGFPNLWGGDPRLRELQPGATPLAAFGTLWDYMRPQPNEVSTDEDITFDLEIDTLDHPMFLWPLRQLKTSIENHPNGVNIHLRDGTWAGVPVNGEVDWSFLPRQRVSVHITSAPPPDSSTVSATSSASSTSRGYWASGHFSVGPIQRDRWKQRWARGEFAASGDQIELRDVAMALDPSGILNAHGQLILSRRGTIPFQASFEVTEGDATAIAKVVGLAPNQIAGRVDLKGDFEGALRRNRSIFDGLAGRLEVAAADGVIRKVGASVSAIAESDALGAFDPLDVVRYQQIETTLEFLDGRMYTDVFSLDGPDIGVVASGEIQLARSDKPIDAKVAVFLFRKLDHVLAKIPILNRLLLGTDENLIAVAFEISGPAINPDVEPILLPLSAGPTSLVLQGVPMFVMKGIEALETIAQPQEVDPPAPLAPTGKRSGS